MAIRKVKYDIDEQLRQTLHICVAEHRKEDLEEATCVSIHYYGNGQCYLCSLLIIIIACFNNKSSRKLGFCLLKVGIILKLHNLSRVQTIAGKKINHRR